MVILCRTRNQANKITQALIKENLPVIEQGGMLEKEYMKDVLAILLLITDASGMGLMRAAHQKEHPFSQQDIEELLLAARQPQTNAYQLLMNGEAPITMSVAGRHSLLRLSHILQSLTRTTTIWSLLAQYLFIETSLMRDLLTQPDDNKQNRIRFADYQQLLNLARHYDQQLGRQQQLAQQEAARSTAADQITTPETVPIAQQASSFLEYLSLLVLLRQDFEQSAGER